MGCGLSAGRQITPVATDTSLEMMSSATEMMSSTGPSKLHNMSRMCTILGLKLRLPCRFYKSDPSAGLELIMVPTTTTGMQTESDIVGFKLQYAQTDSQILADEELEAMMVALEGEMKKIEEECKDRVALRRHSEEDEEFVHKTWKNIVKTHKHIEGLAGGGGGVAPGDGLKVKVNIAVQAIRRKISTSTQTKFGEVDHQFVVPNSTSEGDAFGGNEKGEDLFKKTLAKVMAGGGGPGGNIDEHLSTLLTSFTNDEDLLLDGEECPQSPNQIVDALEKTLSSFDNHEGGHHHPRATPLADDPEDVDAEAKVEPDDTSAVKQIVCSTAITTEELNNNQNNDAKKGTGAKGKLKHRLSLMKQQKFNTRLQMLMEEIKAQNALELAANVKKRDVALQTTNDILTDEGPEFAARSPLCHKNEMIPSVLMFREVDKKVRDMSSEIEDAHQLVKAIVAFAKNDLFKVRAMFVWITTNIKLDYAEPPPAGSGEVSHTANEIIARGRGTSKDYCHLFAELGRLIGIRIKKLNGFARSPDFRPGYHFRLGRGEETIHYWNAIYLLSSWRLVDLSFAAGTIDELGEFRPELSEHYFLIDPNVAIWSHFPFDELEENYERWQLLDKPLSLAQFNALPKVTAHFFEHNLSIRSRLASSPHEFRICTEVKVGAHEPMRFKYKFYPADEIENGSLNHYVFCQLKEDRLVGSFMVTPPLEGRFFLKVFAKPEREMHGSQQDLNVVLAPVVTFALECTKARKYIEPFPLNDLPWGPTQKFYDFKLKVVSQKGPIVVTWGGKRRLVLESMDTMLLTYSLFDADSMEMDAKSIVSKDEMGNRITFTINPPRVGTFKFNLFGMPKPKQKGKWKLPLLSTWLIDCKLIKPVVHDEDFSGPNVVGNGTVATTTTTEEAKDKKK